MARRQTQGSETWKRLRDWDRGQTASERLAPHLLRFEGYNSVDPSHPLGGPDGLKDVICILDGVKWIGSAYFPKGQQDFPKILGKFKQDLKGVYKNEAEGIIFVTNQELTLGERENLIKEASSTKVDLLHLERISSILDSPACYGLRLEYLDIEMTKEEQLAFMAATNQLFEDLRLDRGIMLNLISQSGTLAEEFKEMRNRISSAEKPMEPYYVTPVSLGNDEYMSPYFAGKIWNSFSLPRTIMHRCTICGFGFFINDENVSYDPTRVVNINHSIYHTAHTRAVICPKCGNVDEI